jgi:hypothetical protein
MSILLFSRKTAIQRVQWDGKIEEETDFLYMGELDEEEGTEYIVRFRIKNWEQIKKKI